MQKKQYYALVGAVIPTVVLLFFLVRDLISGGPAFDKPHVPVAATGGASSLALVMSSAVALLAVAAAILLYRRQFSQPAVSPATTSPVEIDLAGLRAALAEGLKDERKKSNEVLEEAIRHATEQRTETLQAFKQLSEIVGTLRRALEEREQEIKRYKQNHDAEIYRKFLRRLIDVCESAQDAAADNPDKPEIAQVKELAEFLLEECDVKLFLPTIGALYREEFGVADSPRYVANTDPVQARRIARVIRPGYVLTGGEVRQVIRPSKVEVFDDVKIEAPSN